MVGLVGLASAARLGRRAKVAAHLSVFLGLLMLCTVVDGWRKPALALLVGPGDSVEVTFFFASPPDVGGPAIDFLALTTTPFTASGPGIAINAQLFDGVALLGEGTRPSAAFVSFSDGDFGNAIAASLGGITDPGFQGRILFTPVFPVGTGFIDFDPDNFNIRAGHGTTTGVLLQEESASITSISIPPEVGVPTAVTPAPAALVLFFSGLVVLGFVLFGRRKNEGAQAG